jgi:anti-anti-sigma factor
MLITTQTLEGRHVLQLQGRFDANWADQVGKAIDSAIRAGHHEVDLDLAEVNYISSAGIRVLLKYHKQLKAARGTLGVLRPTAPVLEVLQLSGIARLLVATTGEAASETPKLPTPAEGDLGVRHSACNGVEFEAYDLSSGSALEASLKGEPQAFAAGTLNAAQSHRLKCTADLLAVGLGAFGQGPDDTQGRFGEALAVAGTAVMMPTDGSSVPDYQVTEDQLVPELHLLYGLTARGSFSKLLRFEASRSTRGVLSLAELVDYALEQTQSPGAGFAILAESASVVGATLQRSPALAAGQPTLAFPGVRDWLSFTTERTDERNLLLIAGIAQRQPQPDLAACLRPIGPGTAAHGHFHAVLFPYRPLPKGRLELQETVTQVIGTETAQTVMHLLADEREFEGVGQTDLMRGACWIGQLLGPGRTQQT